MIIERIKMPIIVMLAIVVCCIGCTNKQGIGGPKQKFPIPYKDEHYSGLYESLVECRLEDQKILELVNFTKVIAKQSGYEITGDELNWYEYMGTKYSLQVKVFENSKYYLVAFRPLHAPQTSLNLEISIEKEANKVVAIIPGS